MGLWIPVTIAAAFFQNLRSALQKHLKGRMGSTGATFARFGFGLPVALLYLGLYVAATGEALPALNAGFLFAALSGGIAQILATFLLVYLFGFRNFMVGTAYSKTEPIQAAFFGFLILGEAIAPLGLLAVVAGVIGVMMISLGERAPKDVLKGLATREAAIGILSGTLFGASAVAFRGASLALGDGTILMRALLTLAVTLAIQTAVMLAWMLMKDRDELSRVLKAAGPSLLVGLMGATASAGWFTAMTLQKVAYVRALGQIELVFTFLASVLWFQERITRLEFAGSAVIVCAILLLIGAG